VDLSQDTPVSAPAPLPDSAVFDAVPEPPNNPWLSPEQVTDPADTPVPVTETWLPSGESAPPVINQEYAEPVPEAVPQPVEPAPAALAEPPAEPVVPVAAPEPGPNAVTAVINQPPVAEPTLVEQTLMGQAVSADTQIGEPQVVPMPTPESLYRPETPAGGFDLGAVTTPMTTPLPGAAVPTAGIPAAAPTPVAPTAVIPDPALQETLAGQREARERALGNVVPDDEDVELDELPQRDNDRFAGSFALFLLRVVIAAILGVRGVQVVFNIPQTAQVFTDLGVPQGSIFAWVLGGLLLLFALMILLGFGTRVAGVLVAALGIATLAMLRWGPFSPFIAGEAGFIGDFDLLVTVIGIVFLLLGSGGWGVDAAMRHGRAKRKLYS
jgi:uncharacterized membrane protein YphA (DoxX/SURF4 family)